MTEWLDRGGGGAENDEDEDNDNGGAMNTEEDYSGNSASNINKRLKSGSVDMLAW